MESTSAWTTYKTQSVEVELPAGYSELKFESLSKDGMANIDYIGWTSADLYAGEKKLEDDSTVVARPVRATTGTPSEIYRVNFGTSGNDAAGVQYLRNGNRFHANGKIFR